MICLRRRNKVQRPEAIEAALFVDLPELLLQFRELIPDAPWKLLVRGPRVASVVLLTIETAPTPRIDPAEPVRMEPLSGPGGGNGSTGHNLGA
jgi:hypothetical protein